MDNRRRSKAGKIKEVIGNRKLMELFMLTLAYFAVFVLLEQRQGRLNIIEVSWDNRIPFCEYFIIPYLLWFPFIAGCVLYFCLAKDREEEYHRLIRSLITGMIIFVLCSLLYPNGQDLRPILTGENIFEKMVILLYRMDTPTNIFPSLHVFNSLVCCIAVCRIRTLKYTALIHGATILLSVSIVLSTVFLKQHSVLDVLFALLLNAFCYWHYYESEYFTEFPERLRRLRSFRGLMRIREKG